jgi:hypothetical protein
MRPVKRPPKAARPETVRQAERWDVNKNRVVEAGLCHPCAAQYAWGLQDGFTGSRPPCRSCSEIVARSLGMIKPNGWRVLPSSPRHSDTTERPGGPQSRYLPPGRGRDGYGSCRVCGDHWSGFAVCHCTSCHHTFADVAAFDQHRVRGRCQDPAARGLVKVRRLLWVGWAQLTAGTPDGGA